MPPVKTNKLICAAGCGAGFVRRERGAVIVLVLVTLLLAAFLLAAFIRRTGTELLADARAVEHRQLRAEAYSALESALAVVAAEKMAENALHSPDENWRRLLAESGYLPAAGHEVEVVFEDESSRISLPQADAVTLQTALEAAGESPTEAERMTNALLAWMREGNDDEGRDLDAPDYESNDPSYKPAHRALRSWEELAAVEMNRHVFFDDAGRATEVLQVFRRDFSLYGDHELVVKFAGDGVIHRLVLRKRDKQKHTEHILQHQR